MLPYLDPDHSEGGSYDEVGWVLVKRNPHRGTAGAPQDCTDSDSPEADGLREESRLPKNACRFLVNLGVDTVTAGAAASPSAPSASAEGRLDPAPSHLQCGPWNSSELSPLLHHLGVQNPPCQADGSDQSGNGERTFATNAPDPTEVVQNQQSNPKRATRGLHRKCCGGRWSPKNRRA